MSYSAHRVKGRGRIYTDYYHISKSAVYAFETNKETFKLYKNIQKVLGLLMATSNNQQCLMFDVCVCVHFTQRSCSA